MCNVPKIFTSITQKVGELGEEIAAKYLNNKGFNIIERNYTRKLGEVDIVCKKGPVIHFIEVKSVQKQDSGLTNREVWRPEENLHPKKLGRLTRTVEIYLMEKGVSYETPWQIDLLCIYIDREHKTAEVKFIENVV